MTNDLSPAWPQPDEAVREALAKAYADGSWGRYHGPHSEQLAAGLAEMHGLRHAWLCSSGTIAVELALRGLKIGDGDEVILAAYDFPGNFRAVEAVGARPVLVDLAVGRPLTPSGPALDKTQLDELTVTHRNTVAGSSVPHGVRGLPWHLDTAQVAAAISPQTKAIIASHLHGSLADMRSLRETADRAGLSIVEDACQVPGAIVQGRPAGAWGDVGVLSFGGSKLLTAGRGGALVTSRDDIIQRIKVFSQRGNEAFPLSELQAAVLVPQLPKLAAANERRLASVQRLLAQTGDLPGLLPLAIPEAAYGIPAFYKVPWLLVGNDNACDSPGFEQLRRRFIAAIQAEGVAMDEGFRGFARRTSNRCRVVGELPQAALSRRWDARLASSGAAGTGRNHRPCSRGDSQGD